MRAIGTGEMVGTAVKSTKDAIGYTFFSYGNVSPIAGNPNYGYLTYQGVDPINLSGSYTTPSTLGGLTYPGKVSFRLARLPARFPLARASPTSARRL
jgi:hypothetical protein